MIFLAKQRLSMLAALLFAAGTCCDAQNAAIATADSSQPVEASHRAEPSTDSGPTIPSQLFSGETSHFALGIADVIHVSVWKNPELSQSVMIGPDGFVSLPLLGDIHVAGMTADALARMLTTRLSAYVVSAQVTVSVVDIRSRQVFVTGQVGKPGGYALIVPTTILQLIAEAGGLNAFAERKNILILRKNERLKFNYVSAIHGDLKQNIPLQPGDTVIVP